MSDLGWSYLTRRDKRDLLRGIADGVAYGGPYHVEIHPADRCNIDCFFCSTAALRGTDEVPMPRFVELLGELRAAGTRALRLSGGGEPLFHRRIEEFLDAVRTSEIPIENLTTNAVLLRRQLFAPLLATCDQITVSLNTADAEGYARMMQTSAKNFDRVVAQIEELIAERRRRRARRPQIQLQFLVWKENYRTIPEMYRLARRLDVDRILFNGLSFLRPEQQMTAAETDEMIELYEEVVRIDEFRCIGSIESYEQDLSTRLLEMRRRIGRDRPRGWQRAVRFATRRDIAWPAKLAHFARVQQQRHAERANQGRHGYCLIGWHSLLIRTTGEIAPCCILQGKSLGNVYRQSLAEVWHGEGYAQFRRELSRILRERESWALDAASDRTVETMCGQHGACPIATFYYWPDVRFVRALQRRLDAMPAPAEPITAPRSTAAAAPAPIADPSS